jgi:hypothetical protein
MSALGRNCPPTEITGCGFTLPGYYGGIVVIGALPVSVPLVRRKVWGWQPGSLSPDLDGGDVLHTWSIPDPGGDGGDTISAWNNS